MIRRFGRRMSVRTIRRWLLATRYWSWCPARCPRLILEHGPCHREWGGGTECGTSDNGDNVSSVMGPDLLYHSDGQVWVCHKQGKRLIDDCIQPNDGNHGPSVMVCGAIHHEGRSELVVVDGAMNRHGYIQIMRNQMLPWATGLFGRYFVYVQDIALPHTARDAAAFFDQQDVEIMDWSARSPDMKPIEYVWDQMSVRIRDMDDPHSTIAELNNSVHQAWAAVRLGRVRTLVETMSRLVRALLAARGGHTCYYFRG